MPNGLLPEASTLSLPAAYGGDALNSSPDANRKTVRLLSYVHLRNIYRSTGAGRVARQLTEHLAQRSDVELHLLADRADYDRVLPLVGPPWTDLPHHFFRHETSNQQARWFLFDRPRAEQFWPAAQVVYCTAESYVPTGSAALVVTLHDAAYFETDAHRRDRTFSAQRLKWRLLYRKLARESGPVSYRFPILGRSSRNFLSANPIASSRRTQCCDAALF